MIIDVEQFMICTSPCEDDTKYLHVDKNRMYKSLTSLDTLIQSPKTRPY